MIKSRGKGEPTYSWHIWYVGCYIGLHHIAQVSNYFHEENVVDIRNYYEDYQITKTNSKDDGCGNKWK